MGTIKTALLSVHDKTGLAEFAAGLNELGVELLSTGGTAATIEGAGLPVTQISEHTGSPEMLGGRVKTLHPKVFAGLLARRDDAGQMAELEEHGVTAIDLVCVNLYPFAATVAQPDHVLQDALEQIDIGGVSLLRAAIKNCAGVVVVVNPSKLRGSARGPFAPTTCRLAEGCNGPVPRSPTPQRTRRRSAITSTLWVPKRRSIRRRSSTIFRSRGQARTSWCRGCDTGRTRTRGLPFTPTLPDEAASAAPSNCTAKSCRTITFSICKRLGGPPRVSRSRVPR